MLMKKYELSNAAKVMGRGNKNPRKPYYTMGKIMKSTTWSPRGKVKRKYFTCKPEQNLDNLSC